MQRHSVGSLGLTFISQLWFSGNVDMEKAQSRNMELVQIRNRANGYLLVRHRV